MASMWRIVLRLQEAQGSFSGCFSGCHCCVRCHGHPAMAPRPPPKLVVTLPLSHSTLQWHPAMAPRPLPQSWSSPSPPTIAHYSPPPTIAHYNGTLQWQPAMAPRPLQLVVTLPPNHSTLPMARYDGTQQWHHVHSPKVGRHPPPQP